MVIGIENVNAFVKFLVKVSIYAICVKLVQHALLIFTSIPQLRLLWSTMHFPCQKSLVVSLVQTPISRFYGKIF
jgi:hypothetical protein